ncbi:hypothetical protein ACX0G7_09800 [Flavitalea antarctica]
MSLFFYAIQEAIEAGEDPQAIVAYLIDEGAANPALMLNTIVRDLVTIMSQNHLVPKRKVEPDKLEKISSDLENKK